MDQAGGDLIGACQLLSDKAVLNDAPGLGQRVIGLYVARLQYQ